MSGKIDKHFYGIYIVEKTYSFKETTEKPDSALLTLQKIEKILKEGLKCVSGPEDYAKRTPQEQVAHLNTISGVILKQYTESVHRQLWYVPRWISAIFDKIILPIKDVRDRIQTQSTTTLKTLPKENVITNILQFLEPHDALAGFGLVGKQALTDTSTSSVGILNAQRLGYKRKDKRMDMDAEREARAYIQELYQEMDNAFNTGAIPKKYRATKRLNWKYVTDHEKTLENLKTISVDDLFLLFSNKGPVNVSRRGIYRSQFSKIRSLFSQKDFYTSPELLAADRTCGSVALREAILAKETEIAQLLLRSGANPNLCTSHEGNALHWAAFLGNVTIVRCILSGTADIDKQNEAGHTPLHTVCSQAIIPNSVEIIRLLLEKGANPNTVTNRSATPLMDATARGNKEVVELLIKHKAQVNAKTRRHQTTALHIACGGGDRNYFVVQPNVHVLRILLEAGANPYATEGSGYSPLHYTIAKGYTDFAELLLQRHPSLLYQKDAEGRTALGLAMDLRKPEMVELLLDHGSDRVDQQERARARQFLAI